MTKDPTSITFVASGGAGKNVAATAVVRCLAEAHPGLPIFVVASHPEVWVSNPRLAGLFAFGRTEQYHAMVVQGRRTRVIATEPYTHTDFVYGERHLIDVWCEQAGVTWDHRPGELYLSADEVLAAREFVAAQPKPVVLFQPFGGSAPPPETGRAGHVAHQAGLHRVSFPLDLAQGVVDALAPRCTVLQVRLPEQPVLNGAVSVTDRLRILAALVVAAPRRLLIDSFMQHAAAALNAPAVVMWGGTSPGVFGYPLHRNLTRSACPTPGCGRPLHHLFDMLATGAHWTCPWGDACLGYTVDEMLAALEA